MMPGQQRNSTILIVDDEPYNVEYLQQTLSDLGYGTRAAYGGAAALDSVADLPPDLILLDVMMPDIDGITVCRMLKGDPATRLIPIVIMTALDGKEDRIRGIEAGADDFLTKPVDDRELLARINAALRTKQTVDNTVNELASATEQLNEMGARVEELALIAVTLRPETAGLSTLPESAHEYLVSRYQASTVSVVERFDGRIVGSADGQVLATFSVSDRTHAFAAALEILSQVDELNRSSEVDRLVAAIALHAGPTTIEPRRLMQDGAALWVYEASGPVLDEVLDMVGESGGGEILASAQALSGLAATYPTEDAPRSTHHQLKLHRVTGPAVAEVHNAGSTGSDSTQFRTLATIFVSDLVDSTALASKLGDRAWTRVLDSHYHLVRAMFAEFGGEEISTAGDGFLALFDRPAHAIRAGLSLSVRSAAEDLPIRIGIHTGEIERTDNDVQGINVHLAARVSAEAGGGEVLVSSTTKDAVAGSALRFEDRGLRELKGIDEPRRVFLVLPE